MQMRKIPVSFYFLIVLFILLALGLVAWVSPGSFSQSPQRDLMTGFLGGILGSILTLVVAFVAWRQLSDISKTTSSDFVLRLKQDFFKEEPRRLIQLIDNDWLKLVQEDEEGNEIKDPFFKVDEKRVGKSGLDPEIQKRLLERKAYSAYDVDDLVLGHFEDVALLWEEHVLDINMIYEMFSWYVETVWKNCEIQKYIETQREESEDIYAGFERLYEECRRIGRTKR